MAQLEFRDGTKVVPDHVRELMADLDTHKFTYEEALRLAAQKHVRDRLNAAQSDIIQRHFRDHE